MIKILKEASSTAQAHKPETEESKVLYLIVLYKYSLGYKKITQTSADQEVLISQPNANFTKC